MNLYTVLNIIYMFKKLEVLIIIDFQRLKH